MNKLSTVIVGLTTVLPLCAQDDHEKKAQDVWFADFDKAVAAAKEQKKDLLVDFTGSDWCGWCIKLHEEVFAHDSFLEGAQKNFVLVALDYPRGEEAKAKVPNPERNQELAQKYGVQGFPTVLLMTPEGDVFGRTGYAPGGPEKYLESVGEMLTKGKARIAEIASLQADLAKAAPGKEHDAVVGKAVTMLDGMTSEDVGVDKVAEIAREAVQSADAEVSEPALRAILKTGQANEAESAKAGEIDPKNTKGLYELSVRAQMQKVHDDASARAFLGKLESLLEQGVKDKEVLTGMLVNATQWSYGPLQDKEGAKKWAKELQKHIAGTPQEAQMQQMIDRVLGG